MGTNRDKLLDFSEKAVLITGAASGFGAGLAKALGQRGARLMLSDINMAGLKGLQETFNAEGIEVAVSQCDVTDQRAMSIISRRDN